MKLFKATDLYLIRPMTLVQINKYKKFKLPFNILKQLGLDDKVSKLPSENTKRTYLSLASDITIAVDNGDSFTSVLNGASYPKYSDTLDTENGELTFVHPNYTKQISEILFAEKMKANNYRNVSFSDILNNGIYKTMLISADKIAEEITKMDFDIDSLKELLSHLKTKEKDKLIFIESSLTPNCGLNNNQSNKEIKVYEKVIRSRK